MDTDFVSGWFVVEAGKVYGRCPVCHSPRIAYHKIRKPGLKGISMTSKGITPSCVDCGKSLPNLQHKDFRQRSPGKRLKKPISK